MPSISKKQHNFMAAVANNPSFAKKAGVPRSVGEEFLKADKGRKFKEGGEMKKSVKKMAYGGKVAAKETMGPRKMGKVVAGGKKPHGEHTVQKSGMTKGKMVKMRAGGMRGC